jgi:hypothetical protein
MDNIEQAIQGVAQKVCPHCQKEILISYVMPQPMISGVFTAGEATEAKKRLVGLLETIAFKNEEEKAQVISWINDDLTMFGMGDVETILKSISMNQIIK